jgi:hypothetical protein
MAQNMMREGTSIEAGPAAACDLWAVPSSTNSVVMDTRLTWGSCLRPPHWGPSDSRAFYCSGGRNGQAGNSVDGPAHQKTCGTLWDEAQHLAKVRVACSNIVLLSMVGRSPAGASWIRAIYVSTSARFSIVTVRWGGSGHCRLRGPGADVATQFL